MKCNLIFLILLALLFSCDRPSPTKISFDGRTFELPMRVDKAQKALDLTYGYYAGFKGSKISSHYSIITQLEDHPFFPGSDTDSEESYYNDYFVGISFFKQTETYKIEKNALEKEYDKKFFPQKDFEYFETNEGLIVVLKSIQKKQYAVCFYKGIPLDRLSEYLSFVNFRI